MAKWLVIIWFAAVLWWAWREGQKDAVDDEIDTKDESPTSLLHVEPTVVEKKVSSRPAKVMEGKISNKTQKPAGEKKSGKNSVKKVDDLKKIDGVGPKLAALLIKNKIKTFAALAATSESDLEEMVKKAKLRIPIDAKSWISQARQLSVKEVKE